MNADPSCETAFPDIDRGSRFVWRSTKLWIGLRSEIPKDIEHQVGGIGDERADGAVAGGNHRHVASYGAIGVVQIGYYWLRGPLRPQGQVTDLAWRYQRGIRGYTPARYREPRSCCPPRSHSGSP